MGLPWYRPTRVCHATSGGEFGGATAAAIGRPIASTVCRRWSTWVRARRSASSLVMGRTFPEKYQRALFCLDWSYGTIYAVSVTPEGASYTGTRETFLARTPLPLTDAAVSPDALYFITGGRGTQSELYRVTYVGGESTAPVDPRDHRYADLRALRHKIEAYQSSIDNPGEAAATLVPLLAHADRTIRYTARASLEHVDPKFWQDKVLASQVPDTLIGGVVALARTVDAPSSRSRRDGPRPAGFRRTACRGSRSTRCGACALTIFAWRAPNPEAAAHWVANSIFISWSPPTGRPTASGANSEPRACARDAGLSRIADGRGQIDRAGQTGRRRFELLRPTPPRSRPWPPAIRSSATTCWTMLNNPKETQKVAYTSPAERARGLEARGAAVSISPGCGTSERNSRAGSSACS